jgi:hypothetical protein
MAQPRPRPGNRPPWDYVSFNDRQEWLENTYSPAEAGLRHGLLAAIDAYLADDGYSVPNKTEQERLLTAIWALTKMVEEAEGELSLLVLEARYEGVTWTRLAEWLDVTRQAVHKRFAPAEARWMRAEADLRTRGL